MKKILLLFSLLVSIQSFAQQDFKIHGTLPDDNNNGKMIYLKAPHDEVGVLSIDSAYVTKNTFTLKGKASDSPYPAFVFFKERPAGLPMASMIIVEPGNIYLTIDENSKVSGTRYNNEFQKFLEEQANILGNLSEDPKSEKLNKELKNSTYNYLNKNMSNPIGEFFVIDAVKVLDVSQVIELIQKSRPDFQQSPKITFFLQELLSQQPSVGDSYIDVDLADINGKNHQLSEYITKNKYVLIDFWASWCGPCVREVPTLVAVYQKYKNKGFEIVGISLDEEYYQWTQAIGRLNMDWVHLSDLKGWRSNAARMYKANVIPLTFLVDNKGKVVAKNLNREQLEKKLQELLD